MNPSTAWSRKIAQESLVVTVSLHLLCLVCTEVPTFAQGTVIYSTYDGVQPSETSWLVFKQNLAGWIGARLGSPFSTGNQAWALDSITAYASGSSPSGLALSIYSDASGAPGDLIFTLATPNDFGTAGNYLFGAAGQILNANTVYWIVGESAVGGSATWSLGTSSGQTFVRADMSKDSGSWNPWVTYSSAPLSMVVNASAVPEPSAFALLAIAALALRVIHTWKWDPLMIVVQV